MLQFTVIKSLKLKKERFLLDFFKLVLKKLIPPILVDILWRKKEHKIDNQYGWFGNYNTWEEAANYCSGYDTDIIIEKVKYSSLKVKNGEAVFERDSVLFYDEQYSWPLLSILLRISAEQNGKLNLIDFGGSLGSTYYQNKAFLSVVNDFSWSVVEQRHYVEIGKKLFEDQSLKFYYSISDCLTERFSNVFLISSVLQYLEFPYNLLETIIISNFEYIIFDRTSFVTSQNDLLTIQRVPTSIFNASLPCWFFNEDKLREILLYHYDLVFSFDAHDESNIVNSYFKGFLFKRKTFGI